MTLDENNKKQLNDAISFIKKHCLAQMCSVCALYGNVCYGADKHKERDTAPYMWKIIE